MDLVRDLKDVWTRGFRGFAAAAWFLILHGLLVALVVALPDVLRLFLDPEDVGTIAAVVVINVLWTFGLAAPIGFGYYQRVLDSVRGETVLASDVWRRFDEWPRTGLTLLLMMLVVGLGGILGVLASLVIDTVSTYPDPNNDSRYVAVAIGTLVGGLLVVFAPLLLLDGGRTPARAVWDSSRWVVRGWALVVPVFVIALLLTVAGAALLGLGLLMTGPLVVALWAATYERLRA